MQAGLVGARRAHSGEEVQVQMHSGYDVWADDLRAPNFTGCNAKTCHPKSVIRPMAVDVMNVHHFHRAAPGAASAPGICCTSRLQKSAQLCTPDHFTLCCWSSEQPCLHTLPCSCVVIDMCKEG